MVTDAVDVFKQDGLWQLIKQFIGLEYAPQKMYPCERTQLDRSPPLFHPNPTTPFRDTKMIHF